MPGCSPRGSLAVKPSAFHPDGLWNLEPCQLSTLGCSYLDPLFHDERSEWRAVIPARSLTSVPDNTGSSMVICPHITFLTGPMIVGFRL